MKPVTSDFLGLLRRACEAEPLVAGDAARLWRRWQKVGQPPKTWTIRWNSRAMALLQEWVGLDVTRWEANGGRIVDIPAMVSKMGGAEPVAEALAAFTNRDRSRTAADAVIADLRDLQTNAGTDRSRRWIGCLLAGGPHSGLNTTDIAWVVRALDFLDGLNGGTIHCSDLGSRVGASSKFFRPGSPGRRMLADALILANSGELTTRQARESALEEAGVLLSPTAYMVLAAGPLTVGNPPLDFPSVLARRDEAIVLNLQNLNQADLVSPCEGILTIENEASFLAALKEGLHRRRLLVATGGFPGRAVTTLLRHVIAEAGSWLHWGDTDLAGVRIARVLENRLGHTPRLFRCTPIEIQRLKDRLIPLSPQARKEMAADLKANPAALGVEVLKSGLAEGGWLEQEAWEPTEARR